MVETKIINGGLELLDPASEMMAKCFTTDPCIKILLSSLPPKERTAYVRPYLRAVFKACLLNRGVCQNVNDWSFCAIWMPPGTRFDGYLTMLRAGIVGMLLKVGIRGVLSAIAYGAEADEHKVRALGVEGVRRGYHYVFMLGTAAEARGKGLATENLRQHQVVAEKDGLPIWLEATTEHSRDVYARCGFEVVGEILMGEGTHDAQGDLKEGGSGAVCYAMVWRPTTVSRSVEVAKSGSGLS